MLEIQYIIAQVKFTGRVAKKVKFTGRVAKKVKFTGTVSKKTDSAVKRRRSWIGI
jgi:hypothetical protein